jgi:hypothetical protein
LANAPPVKKPEVRLDPALQARLLAQMREEQSAAIRARRIKLFVLAPAVIAATVVSTLMAFSSDSTTAIVGNVIASSLLMLFWKLRKRIGASLGFS